MTEPLYVGFVCEGITDTPILEAVVEAVVGAHFLPLYLQPEPEVRPDGELGWTSGNDDRVEQWCRSRAGSLQWAVFQAHVIVVHLDADRCSKYQVDSTSDLCSKIKSWLGPSAADPRLVIVIPAQASEAWLVAANLAPRPRLETTRHPEEILASEKLLDRSSDGKARKDRETYRELAARLRDRAHSIRSQLVELDRFMSKLELLKNSH